MPDPQINLDNLPDKVDLSNLPDDTIKSNKSVEPSFLSKILNNPTINTIANKIKTGPFGDDVLKGRKLIGAPESEESLLPKFNQPETYWGGFGNSLYNDFIRPLATPSGMIGSSMPEGELPIKPSESGQLNNIASDVIKPGDVKDIAKTDLANFKQKQLDAIENRPPDNPISPDEMESGGNNIRPQFNNPPRITGTEQSKPTKLKLSTNLDGTLTNKDTGEVIDPFKFGNQIISSSDESIPLQSNGSTQSISNDKQIPINKILPKDLQGAKPRFNIGYNTYQPQFQSDIDKALYIIAQKKPSNRDADYLKFAMDATGLDETSARQMGSIVRNKIKSIVGGQEQGPVDIPTIWKPKTISDQSFGNSVVGKTNNQIQPPNEPIQTNSSNQPPIQPPNKDIPRLLEESNQPAQLANEQQKESLYSKIRNTQRTLLTSYDFSAPGRQGMGLITHPEYWTSFDDMFKAWGSKRGYDTVNESIMNDPSGLFKPIADTKGNLSSFADKAGLDLTDQIHKREEMFQSNWAEKYFPGVDRSSRAYTAFLNKARADVFKKLVKQAGAENNLSVAKQIADSINISTGRGKLGGLERSETAMKALNEIFFAPKLASSRVQMYTRVLNPKTYTQLDPVVRQEALRSLLGVVGTGLLTGELARMVGAEVSNDPTSADFRKIKIGNTRIDPFAGLQQYGVAATKLLSGKSTSTTSGMTSDLTSGRYGAQTRGDVATNFATNKLAPIPSFVWAWMNNKEFDGTPFDVKQGIVNRTVPLVIQDLNDLRKEDPNLLPLGILPVMGVGMQTYGR